MHLFWLELDVENLLHKLGTNYASLDRKTEIFFAWVTLVAGSRNGVCSQYLQCSIRDFTNILLSLIA